MRTETENTFSFLNEFSVQAYFDCYWQLNWTKYSIFCLIYTKYFILLKQAIQISRTHDIELYSESMGESVNQIKHTRVQSNTYHMLSEFTNTSETDGIDLVDNKLLVWYVCIPQSTINCCFYADPIATWLIANLCGFYQKKIAHSDKRRSQADLVFATFFQIHKSNFTNSIE